MTRPILAFALPFLLLAAVPAGGQQVDPERAQFGICSGSGRVTCVVDGDTIWYRGDKIRLADINTPEISRPACAEEARLGTEARDRLADLLNAGAFSLETEGHAVDRYGRLLRIVTRNGTSLGDTLVAEGLAEQWQGRRSGWCNNEAWGG
jgi:micrococcal nuclease